MVSPSSLLRHVPVVRRLLRARDHIIALQREVIELKQRLDIREQSLENQLTAARLADPLPSPEIEMKNSQARMLTLPYHEVPIFIVSFNRISCLRQLIDWLTVHGYCRIYIVDNASTYRPLLDYYEAIEPTGVTVIRLTENLGSRALWDANLLEKVGVTSEFVYTDPDVVPAEFCPGSVVHFLQNTLNSYPEVTKVGLGLRLDSIPLSYRYRAEVLRWEAQFWRRPVARFLMAADIDTTFALYRAGAEHPHGPNHLRTTYPYLAEHLGWHVNSDEPSDEDRFYAASARMDVTNWSGSKLGSVGGAIGSVPNVRLMHLGCGKDVYPGWLNVDIKPGESVRSVDLDALGDSFSDLTDNSFDGFYGCHVFEHLNNSLKLMDELYRIAKPNARMVLRVPYGSSNDAHEDPTHRRALFEGSFVYYAQPAYSRADYDYSGDWAIERVKLVLWPDVFTLPSHSRSEMLRRNRNTVQEMVLHMRAIKPARPRDLALLVWPTPEFSRNDLDFDANFAQYDVNQPL